MKVVVGLGNPGEQYAKTRHNVGWMVVDRLADRAGWAGRGRTRDASSVVQGRFHGLDLVLAKPLTFMNLSGEAVGGLLRYFKIDVPDLLVVVDEVHLPLGRLRARANGSAADAALSITTIESATSPKPSSMVRPMPTTVSIER